MRTATILCAPVVTLVASSIIALAQTNETQLVTYGRHLAQECASCHRIDGKDHGIPSIVGRDVAEFLETMNFYRNGQRSNPAMVSVAQSLDAEQLRALAQFYSTLSRPGSVKRQTPKN